MCCGQQCDAVGADFVRGIAVRRNAVGTDDDFLNLPFAHDLRGHVVAVDGDIEAAASQFHAVSRAPCNSGRVSSANTRSFLPCSWAEYITANAVP